MDIVMIMGTAAATYLVLILWPRRVDRSQEIIAWWLHNELSSHGFEPDECRAKAKELIAFVDSNVDISKIIGWPPSEVK